MTTLEFVIACICGLILCAAAIVMLLPPGRTRGSTLLRDGTHVREIHQSMIIFAREFETNFPRPDLIASQLGKYEPDITLNTTANLYSVMVMRNYIGPEILVSPMESNSNVQVHDGYDYDASDPTNGIHWDNTFQADLHTLSHASYAHMPIFGSRAEAQWRESLDSKFAIMGNRGPLNGIINANSITCEGGSWTGNVCYNDNHIAVENSFTPEAIWYIVDGKQIPDNIFAMEDGPAGGDAILSFTRSMNEDGPELQHD